MKPETKLTKCPFCDYPRTSGFVCERCGADLVWLIPWSEGGAALMLEDALPQPPKDTQIMD